MTNTIDELGPFVGEWRIEAFGGTGRSVFTWSLDGAFLEQRTEVDHPDAPDSLSITAVTSGGEGFTQHYFDTRGVVRLYAVTFAGGVWTSTRESEDFTPLDFRQRYVGRFNEDGRTINGTWEIDHGNGWEKDFDLDYFRTD